MKKILIVFLVIILLLFISRDLLLKVSLSCFLNKKTPASISIGKAKLLHNGVIISDLTLFKGPLNLKLEKAKVTFDLFNRSIKDLMISNGNLRFRNITANLSLVRSKNGLYVLGLSTLKFKDKEIANISIPLAVSTDTISFDRVDGGLLGYSADISGVLNYQDRDNICLSVNLRNASFKDLISIFSKEDEFVLIGEFDGNLKLCLDKGEISKIDGDFYNSRGGNINIENEASLSFLQRYLDQASYDTLVDNFKHYAYNRGSIKITKKEATLALNLDFGSDELGRRNILVNLHNILGGGE